MHLHLIDYSIMLIYVSFVVGIGFDPFPPG